MPGPYYQVAIALGDRVLKAQAFERDCAELYCAHPDSDAVRDAWLAARRLVEGLADSYLASCDEMVAAQEPAWVDPYLTSRIPAR